MKRLMLIIVLAVAGCASGPPIDMAEQVDLPRFMGDWYVIAHIPVYIEAEAFNAVESYRLLDDQTTVATTFAFNKGSFDGPARKYHPTGFVRENSGNARWGMRFVWPLKSDYRICYVSEDYQYTIVGRQKRDYVWVMARSPIISGADYQALLQRVIALGYDPERVRRVPQQALAQR